LTEFDRANPSRILAESTPTKLGQVDLSQNFALLGSGEILIELDLANWPNTFKLALAKYLDKLNQVVPNQNLVEFGQVSPNQILAKSTPTEIWQIQPSQSWLIVGWVEPNPFLSWPMRNSLTREISISFFFEWISNSIILVIWNTFLKFFNFNFLLISSSKQIILLQENSNSPNKWITLLNCLIQTHHKGVTISNHFSILKIQQL